MLTFFFSSLIEFCIKLCMYVLVTFSKSIIFIFYTVSHDKALQCRMKAVKV